MPEKGTSALRADARRNKALVLQAARTAFEERGLDVPLGEIARRAGVGAGTVYRHFPSKDALFKATVADRLRLFTDTARDLADVPDPGEVFFRFIASVVRIAAQNKAMCAALDGAAMTRARPVAPGLEREFWSALEVLLHRAQRAGAVRKDVVLADVRVLLTGCMAMEVRRSGEGPEFAGESGGGQESAAGTEPVDGPAGRMTALMCDALRAGRDVTKLPFEAAGSNETLCEECGVPVQTAHTGRPARYCGGACRQKAHRTRSRARSGDDDGAEGLPAVDAAVEPAVSLGTQAPGEVTAGA
ncbi:TetR/AcrR family transcriptional regulator [Streptomyces sp. Ru73]|uniref:TetR/AcrR family transcriptional regulator n=1 Tax=Streptomyces sp. Ru73 TaxID=2080748 RepID=UPI000CDE2B4C|nr:TetR/AcrR family transcriptional regulator [Streptomyces sp. Ru73]POX40952.1 TetR/AcrR family transcriptional regulator [Streptomyces sp. Ru73]